MKALKWIGIILGGLFALFLIAGIALYFSVKPYLSSESFRKMVEDEVSKSLQVEVALEPLQWSGLSVFTNSIKTVGKSKVAIKSLDAEQIRISIALRPLLDKIARVDAIEIQSLSAEFQVPEPEATPEKSKPSEPSSPPPAWIQSIAPTKVVIAEINVHQGKLRWPAGENTFGQLASFKVNASVDGDDFNLVVRDGKLEIPQIPPLTLQTLKGRAHQKQIYITTATLQCDPQGTFTLDGELGFDTPNTAHLNFEIDSVPVTPFLSGDWRARLLGNINGKFKLNQDEKTGGAPQIVGNVEMTQGKIDALPIFNKIAEITKIDKWKSVPLDRAKAHLDWTPQKTSIDEIDFESKGLLLLQGKVEINGNDIAGNTIVGSTSTILKPIPGLLSDVFNQTSGEYATTPVVLSGTKDDLKEDLSERLAVAVVSGLLEKVPGGDKIKNITDELQKKAPGVFDFLKK